MRATATVAMFRPRRSARRARVDTSQPAEAGIFWAASTAAHRTRPEPCLVIGPRRTVVSDSRCRGVNPAQDTSRVGSAKRCTSPISATNTAARVGPTPGKACRAR